MRLGARAGFDHGEALDQAFERVMHGFERFVRALVALGVIDVQRFEIALERRNIGIALRRGLREIGGNRARHALGGDDRVLTHFAHLQGQLLDAALDRREVAEFLIGRLDPFGDPGDLAFQMLECGLIVRKRIGTIELVGQRLNQRFQMLRQRPHLGDAAVERVGQFVDAVRERVEAGRAGRLRDMVDARAQRLHVARQRSNALGGCNAGGEFAQLVDRGFQIAQRFRVGRAAGNAVHLVRQLGYPRAEIAEAFGRRHRVKRRVHLGKVALDALERGWVGAVAMAVVDPLGERVHVVLQGFERTARQRLVDGMRDVGKVRAQRRDGVLDGGRAPQRFDLRRDVMQLPFEAGEIRARKRRFRGRCCRRGCLFERALPRFDLGNGLIDTEVDVVGCGRRRIVIARRRLGSGAPCVLGAGCRRSDVRAAHSVWRPCRRGARHALMWRRGSPRPRCRPSGQIAARVPRDVRSASPALFRCLQRPRRRTSTSASLRPTCPARRAASRAA